ncbi:Uncharacterized protein SCF082_LOCUS42812 [Durusdinium trenchii]|uniref:Uncharacterized protein n=1 Tax=Durusdinium trenchii TaxID=1381693 RepID=A0ABP0QRA5_9DINO
MVRSMSRPRCRGLRRLRRLRVRSTDPIAWLKRLPEQEQRARLLELLRADLQKDEDVEDVSWRMPALTADGRTANAKVTFETRQCQIQLQCPRALENLTKTCQMVFALDGSSWMSCKAEPQCLAERLAQEIFRFHVGTDSSFDPERSGAEWWAQVRDTGHEEEGIQFHWDTDEAAVERHGINVHPHLSTVTYLTDCGAPTLILDCRNTRKPCETSQVYGEISGGALSWPERWKHIAFDGQLLHGTVPGGQGGQGGRRITFLVNIWLNHRPSNCRRLSKALRRRVAADLASPVSVLSTTRPATWRSDGDGVRAASKRTFRFGRQRLLHEVSCKLPSAKAASTLQLCWSKGEAVIGPVKGERGSI